ncbi:MAG: hypothetical protein VKM17_01715 [Cyanobacteriota bacterium]|nr:hypothetical protein [Cyanobacteriota bacterium]
MQAPPSFEDEPLVMPLPDEALVLADRAPAEATPHALAVLALQQQMAAIGLSLPLGPSLALDDPERLLLLNGFRVQLVCAPYGADTLSVDHAPWQEAQHAPHFLLAAWVEEELQVVRIPGVLTNREVIQLARAGADADTIALPLPCFQGGVDRLLSLVQLLDAQAMPLQGLAPPSGAPLPVASWLQGLIDDALLALGAQLQPASPLVFRAACLTEAETTDVLAILAIPLGVVGDGLCWGEARAGAIERFQLQLIACGESTPTPTRLRVRLVPQLAGDVLPDGLRLLAGPQAAVSGTSQGLELEVSGSQTPIQIAVEWKGEQLRLPPLLLPSRGAEP